jgi:anti-sigma factor RsiW
MKCEQAEELISALVDDELTGPERAEVESHLKACPKCGRAYEWGKALNSELRAAGAGVVAPAGLREAILSNQLTQAKEAGSSSARGGPVLRLRPLLRPVFVSALLVAVVVSIFFFTRASSQPISLTALEIRAKIDRGEVALQKQTNTDELHAWLRRSVKGRFGPLGYDFSPLNVKPVGATVQEIGGRQILVAVFKGNGLSIMCFTFLGTEEDAPKDATTFFDRQKKMTFYAFSRDGIHAVLHREDKVICILVSNMPSEELLSLVRSTSPHGSHPATG